MPYPPNLLSWPLSITSQKRWAKQVNVLDVWHSWTEISLFLTHFSNHSWTDDTTGQRSNTTCKRNREGNACPTHGEPMCLFFFLVAPSAPQASSLIPCLLLFMRQTSLAQPCRDTSCSPTPRSFKPCPSSMIKQVYILLLEQTPLAN